MITKKILFGLCLLICSTLCRAQVVDTAVNKLIASGISAFSNTLDSTIYKGVTGSGTTVVIIDTLKVPLNSSVTFKLDLKTENVATKETGIGYKYVEIKNIGGVYTVAQNKDIVVYVGQTSIAKLAWNVVIVNGLPVIRGSGVVNVKVNWVVAENQTLISL